MLINHKVLTRHFPYEIHIKYVFTHSLVIHIYCNYPISYFPSQMYFIIYIHTDMSISEPYTYFHFTVIINLNLSFLFVLLQFKEDFQRKYVTQKKIFLEVLSFKLPNMYLHKMLGWYLKEMWL